MSSDIINNVEDLREKMSQVSDLVSMVQIDVLDGDFVVDKSWPYLSTNQDGDFANILSEDIAFPFWDRLDFEVDMMVENPEAKIPDWIKVGASRIIVHVESTDNLDDLVKNFRKDFPLGEESLASVELGLALEIDTPSSVLESVVNELDFVQCMGIAEIGRQGVPFDERVFDKIAELKDLYPDLLISVDGGVSLENAGQLLSVGASRLVSGSAIFESKNISETIRMFEEIENQ